MYMYKTQGSGSLKRDALGVGSGWERSLRRSGKASQRNAD